MTNQIIIKAPRWHDGVVLIADHRITEHNEVVIQHKNYPNPLYMSGTWAKQFPTEQMKIKRGGTMKMRVIPLDELIKERIEL